VRSSRCKLKNSKIFMRSSWNKKLRSCLRRIDYYYSVRKRYLHCSLSLTSPRRNSNNSYFLTIIVWRYRAIIIWVRSSRTFSIWHKGTKTTGQTQVRTPHPNKRRFYTSRSMNYIQQSSKGTSRSICISKEIKPLRIACSFRSSRSRNIKIWSNNIKG